MSLIILEVRFSHQLKRHKITGSFFTFVDPLGGNDQFLFHNLFYVVSLLPGLKAHQTYPVCPEDAIKIMKLVDKTTKESMDSTL